MRGEDFRGNPVQIGGGVPGGSLGDNRLQCFGDHRSRGRYRFYLGICLQVDRGAFAVGKLFKSGVDNYSIPAVPLYNKWVDVNLRQ
ncbi:hypothetical protein [Mycobacterium sp. GA-1841]|uniref:hypothetical protein n=1 Tax=Mycobacterium sp. GA-1841 TaxID=1834154 RepID=UPI0011158344|nr:hypothetical protein [Mycobacterium sp. GA-1841]